MPNIITPISLWKNFDDSLPLMDVTTDVSVQDGITYERVKFLGRDTGDGRVCICGVYARQQDNASSDAVLIIPDGKQTVDLQLLATFVKNGYFALMVDIRGEWEGTENYTVYPECISYANYALADRRLGYVDESADKTTWYEWVAVGLYARKYLAQRSGCERIGVVGIRDGGEVAWKLAFAGHFACAVPVCAGGWRTYRGYKKFGDSEPEFDEERRCFIAAIDSQSYAPIVRCPVLMLCSTNDPEFDYDRAYDTFSRINPQFIDDSVISYSIKSNACIGIKSVKDMFMFLDKHVKQRQVYISKPAELTISVDEQSNLVARAIIDDTGDVEQIAVYMAEDCISPTMRDWVSARPAKGDDRLFYLDVYEKTNILFAICSVTYSNGFTVWSKITVKKLSGTFRNSLPKSKVMYSSRNGTDCFALADCANYAVAGTFFINEDFLPKVVDCGDGLRGLYSPCGLSTYRFNNPRYMPSEDSVLKMDVYAAEDCTMELIMTNVAEGEKYFARVSLVGGVWQNCVMDCKLFKSAGGKTLPDFGVGLMFTITCPVEYAVNNVMWL